MTLINNELPSLELRLNELWNVVDVFHVSESVVPFKPDAPDKPLHLTERWDDFARFHGKMVLHVIPEEVGRGVAGSRVDLVDWRANFKVQERQRESMWAHLVEALNVTDEDLIIKADLDELPRPGVVEELACNVPSDANEEEKGGRRELRGTGRRTTVMGSARPPGLAGQSARDL